MNPNRMDARKSPPNEIVVARFPFPMAAMIAGVRIKNNAE
jgi:hypothetical protein